MSTTTINKEERIALANRIGLVKKRKAEVELPRPFATKPSAPLLRSILTNGAYAQLPLTPPDSSPPSVASPPENKRKREEEESAGSVSKKVRQAHECSNVEESNGNKRKYSRDAGVVDTTSPHKKINITPSPHPIHPQKSPAHKSTTTPPTTTKAGTSHKPRYTPQNPPPNTRFTGLRWNPASNAWDSKFTPINAQSTSTSTTSTTHRIYPFNLNPHNPRAPTSKRKVLLPHDPSLTNRWRTRLAEMMEEEEEAARQGRGRRQQWEWEIDGGEEEEDVVVIEGKGGSNDGDGEGGMEGRLDAVKAEELRARAARRGRKSS